MYMTIEETAEYLSMPVPVVQSYILANKIKALHDGEQYLVNVGQFTTHFEQVEKYRKMIDEFLSEPLPEDMDVKDED